jgi:cytochrome c oxidase cbb3-type subunit 3
MRSIFSINKKILLALTALFCVTTLMGQNATGPVEKTVTSSNNLLVYLLVTMSIVLAFVIWGLGQALVTLSKQVVEKNKSSSKIFTTTLVIGFMLLSQILQAQNGEESIKVLPNYGGLSSETFYFFVAVISAEIITILFLALSVRSMYSSLLPEKEPAPVKVFALKKWWARIDKRIFTKATPVEKEADILLDHNYDGIQELDNALPPWWKYGFYLTIGVAVIYLLNFHVFGTGKNPTQEYDAEIAKARIEKEIYESKNKDKIDENNVPMADAAGLETAKGIFTTQCFACHGKLGEGGAGPNLTDDYWLHKGSLNDIYHTIKNGYPEKGMQSWAAVFSPKEISFLASYVKSLHGTKPANAKAPQGDLETETSPSSAPADSVKSIKTDSLASNKQTAINK